MFHSAACKFRRSLSHPTCYCSAYPFCSPPTLHALSTSRLNTDTYTHSAFNQHGNTVAARCALLCSLCSYSHPPSHSKATALRRSTKLSHTGALPGSHSGIHTHRRSFTQAHTHTGAHSHRHSFGQALSRSFSLSHCCATRFVSCCVLRARS